MCFGTDYPFPLGECYPLKKPAENIDGMPAHSLSQAARQQMLGLNACDWLGVDPTKFLSSPHRAHKLSEARIVSKVEPGLVGKYTFDIAAGAVVGGKTKGDGVGGGEGEGEGESEGGAALTLQSLTCARTARSPQPGARGSLPSSRRRERSGGRRGGARSSGEGTGSRQ